MDSMEISRLVNLSPVLKYRFEGCRPLDQISAARRGTFQIVNTEKTGSFGEHWLLIARSLDGKTVYFYDSFGRPLHLQFPIVLSSLNTMYKSSGIQIKQIFPSTALTQSNSSTLCGLYCIFLAHFIYSRKLSFGFPMYATEEDILRFVSDNFGATFPRRLSTI